MTDTHRSNTSPKLDPEQLQLRASPRRAVRFRGGVIIAIAAVGSSAIFGVAMVALRGPAWRINGQMEDRYNTERKPTAEGIDALPKDYSGVTPKAPVLGPPLPGDLGRPILERQRQLGIAPGQDNSAEEQRLAQQAISARESQVLFRIDNRPTQTDLAGKGRGAQQSFEPLPQSDATRGSPSVAPAEGDQNNQQRKLDFIDQKDAGGIYNPHALQTPVSRYQLMAGSVIAASLITGINSDLPGLVVAQVTENVHDTVTGSTLLIPQGSRLIGTYDSVVAFGQKRALLVWQRIVMPDGSSIKIDNLPATDTAGYAGLEDKVDLHTWQLIKGVAVATLLGVGTELSFGRNESDLVKAIRQSTQQNVSQAGQRITDKNLNIQPTITVRPGWPLRVILYRDVLLRPYTG
ncbi:MULTISPECIES: TrbI/VirB10 family protein [unclassified Mesorhizobium]|uniref:TrbI/VirB10 family protein n=1 Tax=unclassified Mesorhizobium TaxID=325217 RepID=UPI0024162934|nr:MULTISPECIES: TrbI/VirB10 family protein [unclassified Mesorhizobium]MDG4881983.1 TrbI/VirB10 family protein [Mesorhizobium sp. WSM4884]WFP65671.1 TrbI/VirB10 family protein [Mesorhizobium sp. WSM4904]WFP78933.1 TrbI/VirB10 family protein [Mesorhizobium sp. WSM4906]